MKHSSIKVLLNLVSYGVELEQLDVKLTFLCKDLEEEIYIAQPEGCEVKAWNVIDVA